MLTMFLWISGFLKDDAEDDALKFDLVVKPEYEDAVLNILGWEAWRKALMVNGCYPWNRWVKYPQRSTSHCQAI